MDPLSFRPLRPFLHGNLSEGYCCCCCHCCHCCHCDGGKTKSTPSLNFGLRLEFDNNKSEKSSMNFFEPFPYQTLPNYKLPFQTHQKNPTLSDSRQSPWRIRSLIFPAKLTIYILKTQRPSIFENILHQDFHGVSAHTGCVWGSRLSCYAPFILQTGEKI